MKRIIGLATATLMGASMLAGPALAQDAEILPESSPGMSTEFGVDTGTTAAIGGSIDGALSAIEGNAATVQSIELLTEVGTVNVVRISDFEDADADTLEQAAEANHDSVESLRDAISANAALSQQLEAQGVSADEVVAAEVDATGQVTLFVL